jgi:hypothetical protein
MLSGMGLLVRLVAAQHRMSPEQARNLADSVGETIRQLGLSLYPPSAVE